MARLLFLASLAALTLVIPLTGQQNLDPVRTYALTNARIVVSPGNVIEQGTVLIRDGRIQEAGAQVSVPAGIATIDLSGRTVYPGLIDAASTIGIPVPTPAAGRGGFPGGPAADAEEVEDPSPSRRAAISFAPTDDERKALRAAGVTTVAVGFQDGIFTGQVAAMSTSNAPVPQLVLNSAVGSQVAFGRNRGRYPGTLMGAIAYIRQGFYNALWEMQAAAAFERNPASAPRPTFDPEATALIPVVSGDMPLWMTASQERMMGRMMSIAEEFDLENYVLVGAQEGYRIADALGESGKPVIVSLDFPDADNVTGRVFELHVAPVSGEDTEGEAADSTAAGLLRSNAAVLAAAGVPVALASWGLDGPDDFRDAILAAVDAGLSADDALRALTVTPAEILGLSGALGTIEAGKYANLVVTDGDLFSADGRIHEVFIDGERFVMSQPDEEGEGTGRQGGRGGSPLESRGGN